MDKKLLKALANKIIEISKHPKYQKEQRKKNNQEILERMKEQKEVEEYVKNLSQNKNPETPPKKVELSDVLKKLKEMQDNEISEYTDIKKATEYGFYIDYEFDHSKVNYEHLTPKAKKYCLQLKKICDDSTEDFFDWLYSCTDLKITQAKVVPNELNSVTCEEALGDSNKDIILVAMGDAEDDFGINHYIEYASYKYFNSDRPSFVDYMVYVKFLWDKIIKEAKKVGVNLKWYNTDDHDFVCYDIKLDPSFRLVEILDEKILKQTVSDLPYELKK